MRSLGFRASAIGRTLHARWRASSQARWTHFARCTTCVHYTLYVAAPAAHCDGAVRVGTCGGILSHTVAARAVRRFIRIESPRSRRELKECPTESAQLLGVPCASQGKVTRTYACKWCGRRSSSCLQVYNIPAPWLQHLRMPACACASRSAPKPSPDCRCLQSMRCACAAVSFGVTLVSLHKRTHTNECARLAGNTMQERWTRVSAWRTICW